MGRGSGVRAVGDAAIQIDFKYRGERFRERLRMEPSARNLRYVEGLKARIEHEIATGAFDYARHFPESKHATRLTLVPGARLTVSHYLDEWLRRAQQRIEPETLRKYTLDADICRRARLADGTPLGDRAIAALSRDDVAGWVDSLSLSAKRIANLLTPLRRALQVALDGNVIGVNPLAGYEIERSASAEAARRRVKDPFTPDEVRALAGTAHGWLWQFWSWTGLRSGEIAALRPSDLEGGFLRVQRAIRLGRTKAPKTAAGERLVSLQQPALEALERRPACERAFVLNPATGRLFESDKQLRVLFAAACAEAGVRYRNPYQLRHTFASWMLSAGENPLWVAQQMGHRDVLMVLRVYGRWIPKVDPMAGQRALRLWQP